MPRDTIKRLFPLQIKH